MTDAQNALATALDAVAANIDSHSKAQLVRLAEATGETGIDASVVKPQLIADLRVRLERQLKAADAAVDDKKDAADKKDQADKKPGVPPSGSPPIPAVLDNVIELPGKGAAPPIPPGVATIPTVEALPGDSTPANSGASGIATVTATPAGGSAAPAPAPVLAQWDGRAHHVVLGEVAPQPPRGAAVPVPPVGAAVPPTPPPAPASAADQAREASLGHIDAARAHLESARRVISNDASSAAIEARRRIAAALIALGT